MELDITWAEQQFQDANDYEIGALLFLPEGHPIRRKALEIFGRDNCSQLKQVCCEIFRVVAWARMHE